VQSTAFLGSCDRLLRPRGNEPCLRFNFLHLQDINEVFVGCPAIIRAFPWSEFVRDVDGELLNMAGALWLPVYTSLEDLWVEDAKTAQNHTKRLGNPFCLSQCI